jgi:Cu/Ag efflux protein CusF
MVHDKRQLAKLNPGDRVQFMVIQAGVKTVDIQRLR